ncbi:hypothetical protein ElyMa_003021900 [Elysia marginata]|uniref:Uncharacterized protein n=1 Tax=Elysia marginata TaxID=1093978 RepID=A0AAV4IK68_9GAST|nr:hypothetical protein ElyMa_003021900 [Elysia marginata]
MVNKGLSDRKTQGSVLTNTLHWAFWSKRLLSTIRPTRYPVSSSPRAYCLPQDRHSTLGFPVQKPTVYHHNRTRPWAFRSKSLLSTARPARYPGLSGLRAYCLPLDRHDTLDFAVQEPTVYR